MKNFVDLRNRISILTSGLDGDFWRDIIKEINPPSKLPEEQKILDMVFRDSKAIGGYIPDVMKMMKNNIPAELPPEEILALSTILGYVQLVTRMLLLILLIPQYNDHDDLITTFNGHRQSLVFIEDYLDKATQK